MFEVKEVNGRTSELANDRVVHLLNEWFFSISSFGNTIIIVMYIHVYPVLDW